MPKAKDLMGQRFGKLTVIEKSKSTTKGVLWKTLCDCGNTAEFSSGNLIAGYNKSCGCTIIKYDSSSGNAKRLYNRTKKKAFDRGYSFNITFDDFLKITSSNCHYCGIEPHQSFTGSGKTYPYIYNGIDRVVNSIGYEAGNIVSACGVCNIMKGQLGYEEFLEKITKIACNLGIDNH